MIVVDASALVAALVLPSGVGVRALLRLVADADQHAPHFIDVEVIAGIRNRVIRGALPQVEAEDAVADFAALSIRRYPLVPLQPRIWELRHNLTPYDASYVALAEILGAPLLTADARLSKAPGLRCDVEVLR